MDVNQKKNKKKSHQVGVSCIPHLKVDQTDDPGSTLREMYDSGLLYSAVDNEPTFSFQDHCKSLEQIEFHDPPFFHGRTGLGRLPLEGEGLRVDIECAGRVILVVEGPHRRCPLDRNPDPSQRERNNRGISASSETSPVAVIGSRHRLQVP